MENKNQILLISLEFPPFAKASGMGDNNRDFAVYYKKLFPNKDLRVLMPFYDTEKFRKGEDLNINFSVDTGYETIFAKIFKLEDKDDKIPVYAIYSDTFNFPKSPYEFREFDLYRFISAFFRIYTDAIFKLGEKENFNPEILHLTDWHTSLNSSREKFKNKKIIHCMHNIGAGYQGTFLPFIGFLLFFSKNEIEQISKDPYFQKLISNLCKLKNVSLKEALLHIKNNIEFYLTNENYEIINELNLLIRKTFKKHYDTNSNYNALLEGMYDCDFWVVDSEKYYDEIINNPEIYAMNLEKGVIENKKKGRGVLIGTDKNLYNPNDGCKIEFPYKTEDYKRGKLQNKLFIQEYFSKPPVLNNKVLNNLENSIVLGSLKKDENAPLFFSASRFDINQKGIDSLFLSTEVILKNFEDVQFILGGPNYIKNNNEITNYFIENVVNSPLYRGRILLIDSFIPSFQYFAASDFFIMSSRFEPGGTSQFQAMAYGCIPVARNTGGMGEVITDRNEAPLLSNGFKTEKSYYLSDDPDFDLIKTIIRAIQTYQNKELDLIIKNAFEYDSSWKNSTLKMNEIYKS